MFWGWYTNLEVTMHVHESSQPIICCDVWHELVHSFLSCRLPIEAMAVILWSLFSKTSKKKTHKRDVTPLLMHWSYIFFCTNPLIWSIIIIIKRVTITSAESRWDSASCVVVSLWLFCRKNEHVIKKLYYVYRKVSNIGRTKCQNINVSHLVLQLPFGSILKPNVKWRMKM